MLLLTLVATLATTALGAPEGGATPVPRKAIEAQDQKITELDLDTYYNQVTVVRERSPGKMYASFSADPQLLDEGSVVVFEINSVAKSGTVPRWRCIAIRDVAECLGAPVKIRYLPADERIVLTAKIIPRSHVIPPSS